MTSGRIWKKQRLHSTKWQKRTAVTSTAYPLHPFYVAHFWLWITWWRQPISIARNGRHSTLTQKRVKITLCNLLDSSQSLVTSFSGFYLDDLEWPSNDLESWTILYWPKSLNFPTEFERTHKNMKNDTNFMKIEWFLSKLQQFKVWPRT